MAKQPRPRREVANQRSAPQAPAVRRPQAAPRPPLPRIIVRHFIWFLPLYLTLIPATILTRIFYQGGQVDSNLMMAAIGLAALGILAMVPWVRLLVRRDDAARTAAKPIATPVGKP